MLQNYAIKNVAILWILCKNCDDNIVAKTIIRDGNTTTMTF